MNKKTCWKFRPNSKQILPVCMYVCIDLSPLGIFRANEINNSNKLNKLRIPTGRMQTSWLCISAAEELNQARPGTNPQPVVRVGFELGISRIQVWRPNHLATLPPLSRTKQNKVDLKS